MPQDSVPPGGWKAAPKVTSAPLSQPGVPAEYGYQADPALKPTDPWEFASEVSAVQQGEPHPERRRIEAGGARLTVSPSMKVPEESPAPTQGMGRVVPSRPGRSVATFSAGASETYEG